jgi:cytochrome c
MMWANAWIPAAALLFGVGMVAWTADDARRGEQFFHQMCTGCHALDAEKEGPRLRGVFGRAAGSVAGFPYSDGLKKARVVWDEATLDKWLTDPSSIAADNDMAFRLENAGQRADIIAYLKTLKGK